MALSSKADVTGQRLKDVILARGHPLSALSFLQRRMPAQESILQETDEMKEFLASPALPYVLRLLTGVCLFVSPW